MTTLFISDLHLDTSRPQITALFKHFLETDATRAQALYILGDLFESWIGDDDDAPLAEEIASALRALSLRGVPVRFLHGNRDFLLGSAYAERCAMTLIDDGSVVDLYGTPTVLLHGDSLCTDDRAYQQFREQTRAPAWQTQFLTQTLAARRDFADAARLASRAHMASARPEIMDVNPAAVALAFAKHGVARMIHGHTHRPAKHRLNVQGQTVTRIVLGDWYEQGSVLRVNADSAELLRLV